MWWGEDFHSPMIPAERGCPAASPQSDPLIYLAFVWQLGQVEGCRQGRMEPGAVPYCSYLSPLLRTCSTEATLSLTYLGIVWLERFLFLHCK